MNQETKIQAIGIVVGLAAYSYAVKKKQIALPYYVIGSFVGSAIVKKMFENNKSTTISKLR